MKIVELVLYGYKRFALSRYRTFIYRPEHKIQFILGTNGSGKSSLMRELSPLPAMSADFEAGGYKLITIQKGEHVYELKSNFAGSPKHSFKKDHQELNPGGTLQVQKELVASHFNINNDVHDILTGAHTFSMMSVSERREWFTRLSKINFNYAIGVYTQLKNKLRDVEVSLKFQHNLLVTETHKVLKHEEITQLQQEVIQLKQWMEEVLQWSEACTFDPQLSHWKQHDETIQQSIQQYQTCLKRLKGQYASLNPALIQSQLLTTEKHIAVHEAQYHELGKQIEEQQQVYEALEKVSQEELKNLYEEYDKLESTIQTYSQKLKFLESHHEAIEASNYLNLLYDQLYELLKDLPANPDKKWNSSYLQLQIEAAQQLQQQLHQHMEQRQKLEALLKHYAHLKSHEKIECPECHHGFIAGYSALKEQQAQTQLISLTEQINQLQQQKEKLDTHVQELKGYFENYRRYMRIREHFTYFKKLWHQLDEAQLFFKDPEAILNTITQARYEIELLQRIKQYEDHRKDLKQLMTLSSSTKELDRQKIEEQLKRWNEQFYVLQQTLMKERQALQHYRFLNQQSQQLVQLIQQFEHHLKERSRIHRNEYHKLKKQHYHEVLSLIKLELHEREQRLSRIHTQTEIVQQIQKQVDQLTLQRETLSAMVKELSPKDGLIAKSLSGFINQFVKKINQIIQQIWLYPFELLPINNSDELDLDYKFEVKVNEHNRIPDILKCSSGMREVIDLAFKIISMHYLDLNEAPIYLDEFGKSMDHGHRIKAFETITQLLAHSHYSQIFVVSHFEHSYGSVKNADLTVLNPDNIVIPVQSVINRVVEYEF